MNETTKLRILDTLLLILGILFTIAFIMMVIAEFARIICGV